MVRAGSKLVRSRGSFAVKLLASMLLLAVVFGCSKPAAPVAEKYPTKPIDVVIPLAAGGGVDLSIRVLTEALSKEFGQPVNVVNKTGGNGIPGTQSVLQAAPDGYTILGDSAATSSMLTTVKDVPFKLGDRVFIAMGTQAPMTYIVNADSPWKTLKDVANAALKDPKGFSWTGMGGTTLTDLTFMQFFDAIGLDRSKTKVINYQGAGQALPAVAGGHVQFGGGGVTAMLPYVTGGKIRVLAITGPKRYKELPDVPTTTEAGFGNVNTIFWVGFSGPGKLPKNVVDRWTAALEKVLKDPDVLAKLEKQGASPALMKGDEFKAFVEKEAETVGRLMSK